MIATLYASKTKLTPTHYRVIAWKNDGEHEELFVRAVLAPGDDLEAALEMAKPRKGEFTLNAIPLE